MKSTPAAFRKGYGLVAFLLLAGLAAALHAAEGPALEAIDGSKLATADLEKGKHVIVIWASWSPRGRDVGARIQSIDEAWKERAQVFTVNFQEEAKAARAFATKQKIEVPVYLDPDAIFAKRYAVTSLPFLLVLENGKAQFAGKLPADPDAAIRRALE